ATAGGIGRVTGMALTWGRSPHERRDARKTSQGSTRCVRSDLLVGLPIGPDLAFWLAMARRTWAVLLPDDLRSVCGIGPLSHRCRSHPHGVPNSDLLHHLVERGPRRNHGGASGL